MVWESQTATRIQRGSHVIIKVAFGGDVVFGVRGKGSVLKESLK